MAIQAYTATINNVAVSVLGGKDGSNNLIAASIPVNSAGVEIATVANPVNTALATLPPLTAGTAVVGAVLQSGTWTVSLAANTTVALASNTTVAISALPANLGQVNIGNFPATQAVSISNVPTVANAALGAQSDAAWSSGNGSVVALQKATVAAIQATTAAVTSASLIPPSPTFTVANNASSLTLKGSPGSLYGCYVTTGSASGYLMMLDTNTAPVNGTVAPKHCIYCPANSTTAVALPFLTSEPFATGIMACFSSTGGTTLTLANALFFKGIAQ